MMLKAKDVKVNNTHQELKSDEALKKFIRGTETSHAARMANSAHFPARNKAVRKEFEKWRSLLAAGVVSYLGIPSGY